MTTLIFILKILGVILLSIIVTYPFYKLMIYSIDKNNEKFIKRILQKFPTKDYTKDDLKEAFNAGIYFKESILFNNMTSLQNKMFEIDFDTWFNNTYEKSNPNINKG